MTPEGTSSIRGDISDGLWNVWFTELHAGQVGLALKVKELLYSGHTPYQRIDILDTYQYGRTLVLYGSIMVTERDEFFYHEMIAHPALHVHPRPRNVLIVGGGDGGTLREVLKHPTVERATMVEIDRVVVEKSREFFSWSGPAFDNPRARVIFDDAARFLTDTKEKFDVILVDSSDPVGPAVALFRDSFFASCKDRLADDGIVVYQTLSPWYHTEVVAAVYRTLRRLHPIAQMYLCYIPTYPSSLWSFAFCSQQRDPLRDLRVDPAALARLGTRYYNAEVHRAAFALPGFIPSSLETEG